MRRLHCVGLSFLGTLLLLSSLAPGLCWGQGLPKATPESVGMTSPRLEQLTATLQGFVDQKRVPGVVSLIMHHGKVVYLSAVGKQDLATGKPMSPDSLFLIASMTKPLTSVAIMMLYEQGKLRLSDPVSRYIPEFKQTKVLAAGTSASTSQTPLPVEPMKREITIEDLLCHRSGLTYTFSPSVVAEAYKKAGVQDTGFSPTATSLAENMRKLAAQPLLFQPGARWNYGLSADVLGRVVEVISGQTLEQFFEDKILKPLRMDDSCFYVPDDKLDRFATLYNPSATGLTPLPLHIRGSKSYFSGGAGLISTVSDYARFLQMLINGGSLDGVRLLKPETVRMMTVSHTDDLPGIRFCLGFARGDSGSQGDRHNSSAYYYWSGAFGTQFFWDPTRNLAGVAMIQLLPSDPVGSDLAKALRTAAYESLMPNK